MTETKHTPGPWRWFSRADPGERGLVFTADREAKAMRTIIGADGQGFAWTVGLHPEADSANADLLAAAPDLLAALEKLERAASLAGIEDRAEHRAVGEALEAARAAITKAGGTT